MSKPQRIRLTLECLTSISVATQELFNFEDDGGQPGSLEAIGGLWGTTTSGILNVAVATILQRVRTRSESGVSAISVLNQTRHAMHTILEMRGLNFVGTFHSHPWPEKARYELWMAGGRDQDLANASDTDKSSQVEDYIEIICAVRQATGMNEEDYEWKQRDNNLSGKLDRNWYSISAWYKDTDQKVNQVPVEMDAADLNAMNDRAKSGYTYKPAMGIDTEKLSRVLENLNNS